MISAFFSSSSAAQDFARSGSLFCVSQLSITSSRPSTPPSSFSWSTRMFAAASAGPSNGAMFPLPSNAQPITIGPAGSMPAASPVVAAASVVPAASPSPSSPPQAASASTSTARAATTLSRFTFMSLLLRISGCRTPRTPPLP
jgi:hypothetical protein